MKLEDKRAIDLTPSQVIRCRELSYGSEGYMEEDLMQILHMESVGRHYRYSRALLVWEDNKIIGWSLLMPMHQSPRYSAYFFVDPLHRRRGCGKLLLQQANTWGSKVPLCFPDDSNEEFFDQYPSLHVR